MELCGAGYTAKTLRVRFDGKYFVVFRADLRYCQLHLVEKIQLREKRSSVIGHRKGFLAPKFKYPQEIEIPVPSRLRPALFNFLYGGFQLGVCGRPMGRATKFIRNNRFLIISSFLSGLRRSHWVVVPG
jgi:hypothetical protein